MKKLFAFAVALAATITAGAQNIAVVNPSNSTSIYQTLDEAIIKAEAGSIIYIPGGGFAVTDNAKIDKKLTIMGVSHRGDTDNVDGATIISGNLNFVKGSSHSAVLGVYVSGNVNIATKEDSVTNFTMRYCNVNAINVNNSKSSGMLINQCYLRGESNFGNCNVRLENNILLRASNIKGGTINHNVITTCSYFGQDRSKSLCNINSSTIAMNFFLSGGNDTVSGSNNLSTNNCRNEGSWGDNPIVLPTGTKWEEVFKAHKGVTIVSDYHLSEKWANSKDPDLTGIGIYGDSGNDFSDEALAPIPRIVSKKVAEKTDALGNLEIEVTVKAQ